MASIVATKIAEGVKNLIIDIKLGIGGTLGDNIEEAKRLGDSMVNLSKKFGVDTKIVYSRMNSPLGKRVGNALEIEECVLYLRGLEDSNSEISVLVSTLGAHLLQMSGKVDSLENGLSLMQEKMKNGEALKVFEKMLVCQNVDKEVAKELCHGDIWNVLRAAPYATDLVANDSGYIRLIRADVVGGELKKLGTGIDGSDGLKLFKEVGQPIKKGEKWGELRHTKKDVAQHVKRLEEAMIISKEPVVKDDIIIS